MPKYIVSGYRRSGTSMMTTALARGLNGVKIFFDASKEVSLPRIHGYAPNPGGLHEIPQHTYMDSAFMRDRIPDNSITKIFYDGLCFLPADDYRIIFMMRPKLEIEESLRMVQEYFSRAGKQEHPDDYYFRPFDVFNSYNRDDINHVIDICKQRRDMQIIVIEYDLCVISPNSTFQMIKDRLIPELDIKLAAEVVNGRFYRARQYAPST